MPKNSPVGIDLKEAWAEAEAALAEEAPEPASQENEPTPTPPPAEEPTIGEPETDEENVDLFADLDETNDGEGEGQPAISQEPKSYNVNGEELTLEQLTAGYLRQSDYTKKTQELADQRKELDKAAILWQEMQKNPWDTIRTIQSRLNQGQPLMDTVPDQPAAPDVSDIDALVAEKVKEMLGSDPRIQEAQKLARQAEQDMAFSQITSDFGIGRVLTSSEKDRVIDKAEELGLSGPTGLRVAFGSLIQEAQLVKAKRAAVKASSSQSNRSGEPAPTSDEPEEYDSLADAWAAAARELGLEELLNK